MYATLAAEVARAILDGFDKHYRLFRTVSAGAKDRFDRGDWAAVRAAHQERIGMYDLRVREAVEVLRTRFPSAAREDLWPELKKAYVGLLLEHQQPELAETFFNSVAARVLDRTYYTNAHIFWRPAVSTEHIEGLKPTYRVYYPSERGIRATLTSIITDQQLQSPWEDLERDLKAVVRRMRELLPPPREVTPSLQVHVLSSLFYRSRSATLIGRLNTGTTVVPFAIPIRKNARGELYLDALLAGSDLAALFSLARAYFMVDMEVPSAVMRFLRSIFPDKRPAELYTALGLHKQGKTLFYRDLFEHLRHSTDRFVIAPGVKGMVMVVFTLPSFPYVFKLIRDRFAPPKDVDRATVKAQYQLVRYHDRVGRMADTLEYSDVALPKSRFDPTLLDELRRLTPSLLTEHDETLVISHLYIERRMVPLDLWLAQADEAKLRHGLDEYGKAIRELAGANIFPGDLLLKNFGVTRASRVVFYDYDEIAPVTECNFREIPKARDDDEALSSEPWFHVGPKDIFPEEFPPFLFPQAHARELFQSLHGDLFTAAFWKRTQERLRRGEEDEVVPYPESKRFPHAHA